MVTYRTSQIARIAGVHPNTVRLYEKWHFIPVASRESNGYRIFTDVHVLQIQLVRAALEIEVLQAGLRKKKLDVVKLSAAGSYDEAMSLANEYISDVQRERANAKEAIEIVEGLMCTREVDDDTLLKRGEVAKSLGITIDTLRNWELNGLLSVRRLQNGYRVYTESDMQVLKIIRTLRCANYSLSSILRMLLNLPEASKASIETALDTPNCDDDIVTACGRLLTSLAKAEENARFIIKTIHELKKLGNAE